MSSPPISTKGDSFIEETLDPDDWEELRALSHRIVDEAVDYLRDVRNRPAWCEMGDEVEQFFASKAPKEPLPLAEVWSAVNDIVMRHPMGNIHPRFWSWYMGSSNFTGALGDFLAAIQGSNLGGGNHAAALMDRQVVNWLKEMMGFPETASGSLVSGGSVANLVALAVARHVKSGLDIRKQGVAAIAKPLCFYASDQVHGCHFKALETLGFGNQSLRLIPSDDAFRIDLDLLAHAIGEDLAAGRQPACVIGTAGTVNTGAIDDLNALAEIAAKYRLWLHVDGCIGALIAIAPNNGRLVDGIARADSIALDPHKWLHAPFEVGCVLVRDSGAHRDTFALTPEYLQQTSRGLAAAEWLYDYGLQTSRGFRALKVWMSLKEHGVSKFGRLIDQNIDLAHYLAGLVNAEPKLELVTTETINIVCFRYIPTGFERTYAEAQKAVNIEIMLRLQESGTAVVSDTVVKEQHCLRVAIANHRTQHRDLDLLIREIIDIGPRVEQDMLKRLTGRL